MAYTIGYLIYGIDATNTDSPFWTAFLAAVNKNPEEFSYLDLKTDVKLDETELKEIFEEILTDVFNLWTTYRGRNPVPMAFGIKIGSFDETKNIKYSEFQKQTLITHKHQNDYQTLLRSLPVSLQKLLPQPELMIMWGSS